VPSATEDVEVRQLQHPFQIADAAVHDETGPGAGVNGGAEIVADERAIFDLAKEIDDEHIPGQQGADDPGVLLSTAASAAPSFSTTLWKSGRSGTMRTVTARPTRTRSG
jgi:hypothetical protein